MLKKLTSILIISTMLSSFAIAQTDYEKKLEYRRKKIEILVKSYMQGDSSRYSTDDRWSTTLSPEAGYAYTYSYGSSRTNKSVTFKEVSNWVIVKGGLRELDDVEFLTITGNIDEARMIQSRVDEKNKWMTIGTIGGVLGLIVAIAGSSDGNVSSIGLGSAISLIGFLVSSMNIPQKHYIPADYALEKADYYNIGVKKELGLPIDYE